MFHRLRPVSFTLPSIVLALSTIPSPAGEVSRWTLDDTLQDSVGANDGNYAGGAAPAFVSGHGGTAQGALSLNGIAERVELPEGAGLPIWANARHSVAAWVRGDRGSNQVLYSESKAGDSSVVFQVGFDPSGATGRAHVLLRNGGAAALIDTILSTTNVLDGTWHHVAWVDDNGSARFYVDGVVEGTVAYARPVLALERITIGATSGALGYSSFLKAAVDDVRVFNHALSAGEVGAMVPSPCPPVTINSAGPPTVLNVGGTEFVIFGLGFVQGQHFGYIGDQPLTDQRLTVGAPNQFSIIAGKSPRLPNGFHTPSVRCADGAIAHAAGRVEAVPPPRPGVNAVAVRPKGNKVADVIGGQTVDVNGIGFTRTMKVEMFDAAVTTLLEITFPRENDLQNLTFVTPPHAEGFVHLRFTVDGAEPVEVPRALEYVLIRPEITWWPSQLPAQGGTGLVMDGVNFTKSMKLSMVDAAGTIPLAFTLDQAFPENRAYFDAPPHRPVFVDLSVRDGAKPEFVVKKAIKYLPLPRPGINFADPSKVSTAGGEEVIVGGTAFPKPIPELMPMELAMVDAAGATTLLLYTYLNASRLTFVTPPHAVGFVGLRVSVEGQEPYDLAKALEYVLMPPEILSVEPNVLPAGGRADVILNGLNFTPSMQLSMVDAAGTIPLTFTPNKPAEFMPENARQVFFDAPPHRPGFVDLSVRDGASPPFVLARAIEYRQLAPKIIALEPNQVSTAGGEVVAVIGLNFSPFMELSMVDDAGTIPLAFTPNKPAEFMPENASLVFFDAPPHAVGFVDLRVIVEGQGPSVFARALAYVAPKAPEITSFTPAHVDARGGEPIAIRGRNFTATTQVVIHAVGAAGLNYEKVESDFMSDTLITAVMPAHKPAEFRVGVRASGDVEPIFATGLLHFVDPAASAPQEIEATLVDRIAEIEWVNPVTYSRVHVYRDGQFHRTLDGNVTFFRDPDAVPGNQVEYMLVGEAEAGGLGSVKMAVAKFLCQPPANVTSGLRGQKNFRVYGGHAPLGPGGGASGGGGNYQFVEISPEGQPLLNYDTSPLTTIAPTELVTGFRLLDLTKKLRIGVHAAQFAVGEGLSLRLLIEPAEPGMVWDPVELTLPSVPVRPEHEWIVVDYNTQNPPPPGSPIPDEENPQPPHALMPPGAYLLTIYAVGGVAKQSYFEVSSDRSDEQIPVAGAGCPPYPLVRVEPTSNFNPTIHRIRHVGGVEELGPFLINGELVTWVKATIEAKVTDLDGDPITKYIWKVNNGTEEKEKESASNKFTLTFTRYGTHSAKLTVWDNRCGTTTEENIPVTIHPPCVPTPDSPNFTFPTPDPSKLHFVTDLASFDKFQGELMQTFRIFVVDDHTNVEGGPTDPDYCEVDPGEPTTHRVQTMLFRAGGPNSPVQTQPAYLQGTDSNGRECLVAEFTETPGQGLDADGNQCGYDHELGGRFWVVRFDMKDFLPRVDPGVPGAEGVYDLWARGNDDPDGTAPWSPWRRVQRFQKNTTWEPVPGSESINVYDPPPIFAQAPYKAGSFDRKSRVYDLMASLAPPGTGSGVHLSKKVDLESEEAEELKGEFPSSNNGLSSAEQTVFLTFQEGYWDVDRIRKGYDAHVLGKRNYNKTEILGAQLSQGGGGSAPGGGASPICAELPPFHDCSFETLVDESFETPLFEVPLFVDPVTGGAIFSMSFATSVGGYFNVSLGHEMRFDACPQGNDPAFDAYFWFNTIGALYFGAEIDMDFVLGIVSTDFGIDVGLEGNLPVIMDLANLGVPQFGFLLSLYVEAWFEVCGLWVFCHEERERLADETILSVPPNANVQGLVNQINNAKASCPGGGNLVGEAQGGGLGGPVQLNAPSRQLSIAASPNGFRQIAVGRHETGRLFYINKETTVWQWPPEDLVLPPAQTSEYSGTQADPEVVFMDNDKILLAWTQSFSNEDLSLAGITEKDLADPQIFNKVTRRSEIVFSIGTWTYIPTGPNKPPLLSVTWSFAQRLSNDQGPNGYRADGKVSLALDPTTAGGPNGPGVWASWVRYETPDMVQLDGNGNQKVQMRQTSIYARQIFPAFAGAMFKISSNAAEIDIEPSVAVAPDGTTFIVWINDPIHDDLVEANIGREILYSKRTSNITFSAPAAVLADPSSFKGLLDPDVELGTQGHGLLVFTALPANIKTTDAGIGSARVLYSVAITDANTTPQFGAPVLIGLKCDTPIYAHAPELHLFHPGLSGGGDHPGFVMTFQQRGSVGSREGAGNAIAMAYNDKLGSWGEPVNLTPDERVHQGIAATITSAGEIVLMHQSPYPARRDLALAAAQGGGIAGDTKPVPVFGGHLFGDLMGQSFPAVADPAISVCRVSDVYAAPGSDLLATIHVANRGFAPTPADLSLTLFHEADGVRDAVASVVLPVLDPGAESVHEVPFTMPRRPVLFAAVVDGVEGEFNTLDNERVCPLGAQRPRDLRAEVLFRGSEPSVVLRWTNTSLYDSVQIYRDGQMLAEVAGTRSSFVDSGSVGVDFRTGPVDSHEYCVRGCIRMSQSVKSEPITVPLPPPPPPRSRFIRTDANADGAIDITDAVFTLAFLFTGGSPPACAAASDANSDRTIDLTDVVYTLGHLFLGGPPPRAPYPGCGISPEVGDLDCRLSAVCDG